MATRPQKLSKAPSALLRKFNANARVLEELQKGPIPRTGQVIPASGTGQRDPTRFAKVVALYDDGGNTWTDLATDGKLPVWCTANPCNVRGLAAQTSVSLKLKMNEDPSASAGLIAAVDDVIAYHWIATPWELVPGRDSDSELGFQGYVVAGPGGDGDADGDGGARMSIGQYVNFPVTMSQTGGSNGNKTTKATYTYTITDAKSGTQITTAFNLDGSNSDFVRFALGTVSAATKGTGYFDSTGTFRLSWCNEQKSLEACT